MNFYLDHPNKEAQQKRLDAIPQSANDAVIDTWIGAVGEHLAQRWHLKVPSWTRRDLHFALREPVFLPSAPALRGIVIVESPPALGRDLRL